VPAIAVAVFVLALSFVVQLVCGSVWWGLLALVLIGLSVASHYVESTYELSAEGAAARSLLGTHRRRWVEVKGRFAYPEGVLLSPLSKPTRLAFTRGLFLRFADNRDEVMARVEAFLEQAAGEPGAAPSDPGAD